MSPSDFTMKFSRVHNRLTFTECKSNMGPIFSQWVKRAFRQAAASATSIYWPFKPTSERSSFGRGQGQTYRAPRTVKTFCVWLEFLACYGQFKWGSTPLLPIKKSKWIYTDLRNDFFNVTKWPIVTFWILARVPGNSMPFDKIDMTLGEGQKARGSRKNGKIKVAFLLRKSVHHFQYYFLVEHKRSKKNGPFLESILHLFVRPLHIY